MGEKIDINSFDKEMLAALANIESSIDSFSNVLANDVLMAAFQRLNKNINYLTAPHKIN